MTIINIAESLPIHPYKRYGKRKLSQIQRIVVHHMAGNISTEEAARYHISKGWPGLGYFAVIDFDGTVYVVNDLDTVSYNVKGGNTPTLGIALRGNYENKEPIKEQIIALESLIMVLHGILGYLPVGVHGDYVNTRCPGPYIARWVRSKYGEVAPLTLTIPKWKKLLKRFWKFLTFKS